MVDSGFKIPLHPADVFHFNPSHPLADHHLDVLVVEVDTLPPVDFLDFVHQVFLQFFLTQDGQDVVRVARPLH